MGSRIRKVKFWQNGLCNQQWYTRRAFYCSFLNQQEIEAVEISFVAMFVLKESKKDFNGWTYIGPDTCEGQRPELSPGQSTTHIQNPQILGYLLLQSHGMLFLLQEIRTRRNSCYKPNLLLLIGASTFWPPRGPHNCKSRPGYMYVYTNGIMFTVNFITFD
jgi:hypothetical protein